MKSDARVRYTKAALKAALLTLMEQKPIKSITVKELCEAAQLNRATFYTHYQDCFDLLEQIEDELVADVAASLQHLDSSDVGSMLRGIFDMLEENAELCRILFSDHGDSAFLKKLVDLSRDYVIPYWRVTLPRAGEQELALLYAYTTNGSLSVLESYIKSDMSAPKERVMALIEKIVYSGLSAFS